MPPKGILRKPASYSSRCGNTMMSSSAAEIVAPLTFPPTRSILWDHEAIGQSVVLQLGGQDRKMVVQIEEKIFRLVQRLAQDSRHTRDEKFICHLIGSVPHCVDGEEVIISIDRLGTTGMGFDAGIEDVSRKNGGYMSEGELEIVCEVVCNKPRGSCNTEDYLNSIEMITCVCLSAPTLDLSHLLSLRINSSCHSNAMPGSTSTFQLDLDLLYPSASFKVTPVNDLVVLPTALSKNLSGPLGISEVRGQPKTGYVTLDATRKALLVLEMDPKAKTLPIVGIWISGCRRIEESFVWAACLRYTYTAQLTDRVCKPPEPFLIIFYSPLHSKLLCYDCQLLPAAATAQLCSSQLSFALSSCHDVIQINQDSTRSALLELPLRELSTTGLSASSASLTKLNVFLTAVNTFLTKSGSKSDPANSGGGSHIGSHHRHVDAVECSSVGKMQQLDDTLPRSQPHPHMSMMPLIRPSVPEVSLILENGLGYNSNPIGADSANSSYSTDDTHSQSISGQGQEYLGHGHLIVGQSQGYLGKGQELMSQCVGQSHVKMNQGHGYIDHGQISSQDQGEGRMNQTQFNWPVSSLQNSNRVTYQPINALSHPTSLQARPRTPELGVQSPAVPAGGPMLSGRFTLLSSYTPGSPRVTGSLAGINANGIVGLNQARQATSNTSPFVLNTSHFNSSSILPNALLQNNPVSLQASPSSGSPVSYRLPLPNSSPTLPQTTLLNSSPVLRPTSQHNSNPFIPQSLPQMLIANRHSAGATSIPSPLTHQYSSDGAAMQSQTLQQNSLRRVNHESPQSQNYSQGVAIIQSPLNQHHSQMDATIQSPLSQHHSQMDATIQSPLSQHHSQMDATIQSPLSQQHSQMDATIQSPLPQMAATLQAPVSQLQSQVPAIMQSPLSQHYSQDGTAIKSPLSQSRSQMDATIQSPLSQHSQGVDTIQSPLNQSHSPGSAAIPDDVYRRLSDQDAELKLLRQQLQLLLAAKTEQSQGCTEHPAVTRQELQYVCQSSENLKPNQYYESQSHELLRKYNSNQNVLQQPGSQAALNDELDSVNVGTMPKISAGAVPGTNVGITSKTIDGTVPSAAASYASNGLPLEITTQPENGKVHPLDGIERANTELETRRCSVGVGTSLCWPLNPDNLQQHGMLESINSSNNPGQPSSDEIAQTMTKAANPLLNTFPKSTDHIVTSFSKSTGPLLNSSQSAPALQSLNKSGETLHENKKNRKQVAEENLNVSKQERMTIGQQFGIDNKSKEPNRVTIDGKKFNQTLKKSDNFISTAGPSSQRKEAKNFKYAAGPNDHRGSDNLKDTISPKEHFKIKSSPKGQKISDGVVSLMDTSAEGFSPDVTCLDRRVSDAVREQCLQEARNQSIVSEMIMDLPGYTSFSPDRAGFNDEDRDDIENQSMAVGESVSFYEEGQSVEMPCYDFTNNLPKAFDNTDAVKHQNFQNDVHNNSHGYDNDDDREGYNRIYNDDRGRQREGYIDTGSNESSDTEQAINNQRLFYQNLIQGINKLLSEGQPNNGNGPSSPLSGSNNLENGLDKPKNSGHREKRAGEKKSVQESTMEQLKKMGLNVNEWNETGEKSYMFGDPSCIINPALIPHLNYVSMLLESTDSDQSINADALAMKYLSDAQLTELAKARRSPEKSGLKALEKVASGMALEDGEVVKPRASDISMYGVPVGQMSFASKRYLRKFGLIEGSSSDDEDHDITQNDNGFKGCGNSHCNFDNVYEDDINDRDYDNSLNNCNYGFNDTSRNNMSYDNSLSSSDYDHNDYIQDNDDFSKELAVGTTASDLQFLQGTQGEGRPTRTHECEDEDDYFARSDVTAKYSRTKRDHGASRSKFDDGALNGRHDRGISNARYDQGALNGIDSRNTLRKTSSGNHFQGETEPKTLSDSGKVFLPDQQFQNLVGRTTSIRSEEKLGSPVPRSDGQPFRDDGRLTGNHQLPASNYFRNQKDGNYNRHSVGEDSFEGENYDYMTNHSENRKQRTTQNLEQQLYLGQQRKYVDQRQKQQHYVGQPQKQSQFVGQKQ